MSIPPASEARIEVQMRDLFLRAGWYSDPRTDAAMATRGQSRGRVKRVTLPDRPKPVKASALPPPCRAVEAPRNALKVREAQAPSYRRVHTHLVSDVRPDSVLRIAGPAFTHAVQNFLYGKSSVPPLLDQDIHDCQDLVTARHVRHFASCLHLKWMLNIRSRLEATQVVQP